MTQQPQSTSRPAQGQTSSDMPVGGRHTGYQDRERTGETRVFAEHELRERTMVSPYGSRIRGVPVVAGFLIGFATWIMLELALFALDLGALAAQVVPDADNSTWWWSGLAAVIAFFVGGLVAGASIPSRGVGDGVLHGITVWALSVVALIVLSAAGAGIGFGVVGDLLATSPTLPDADTSAINDAQTAAAAALLALALTLAAAAIGGAIAAKMWPGRDHERTIDLRRTTM
ncbi:MAG TPA: permease [Actinomycetes bacterium]|nr:permease [Actinomycetes bacterium]